VVAECRRQAELLNWCGPRSPVRQGLVRRHCRCVGGSNFGYLLRRRPSSRMEARDGTCKVNGNPPTVRRRDHLYQAFVVGFFCAHGLILGKRQRTERTTLGG
jgi:hypothetical protein